MACKQQRWGPWDSVTDLLPSSNGARLNIPQVFPTAVLSAALQRPSLEKAFTLESRRAKPPGFTSPGFKVNRPIALVLGQLANDSPFTHQFTPSLN